MEVLNFILITVFLAVSAFGIAKHVDEDSGSPLGLIFFILTAFSCFISIMDTVTKPKDSDVLNGRAEYVETIHISKGDTIKTYHIQRK